MKECKDNIKKYKMFLKELRRIRCISTRFVFFAIRRKKFKYLYVMPSINLNSALFKIKSIIQTLPESSLFVLYIDGISPRGAIGFHELENKYNNIIVCYGKKNQGVIEAWNRPMKLFCKVFNPKYCCWVSDHDKVEPNYYTTLSDKATKSPGSALYYSISRLDLLNIISIVIDKDYNHPGTALHYSLSKIFNLLSHNPDKKLIHCDTEVDIRYMVLKEVNNLCGMAIYGMFDHEYLKLLGYKPKTLYPDRALLYSASIISKVTLFIDCPSIEFDDKQMSKQDIFYRQMDTLIARASNADKFQLISNYISFFDLVIPKKAKRNISFPLFIRYKVNHAMKYHNSHNKIQLNKVFLK